MKESKIRSLRHLCRTCFRSNKLYNKRYSKPSKFLLIWVSNINLLLCLIRFADNLTSGPYLTAQFLELLHLSFLLQSLHFSVTRRHISLTSNWRPLRPIHTRGFLPEHAPGSFCTCQYTRGSIFKFAQFAPGACSQIFNRLNIVEHFAGWKFCSRRWSIPMKSLVHTEKLWSRSVPLEHAPGAKSLMCIGL